ncbi:MAG: TetR/AcrR family transcriptional regulator [Leucobacter sp.]
MSARRDHLLDLAERVLERDGLEAFGVNALAREAGIRPPSLYKHFAGASELEHALVARWFRRLAREMDGTVAGSCSCSCSGSGSGSGSRSDAATRTDTDDLLTAFASVYREVARGAPQLYRLATERPLDREMLERIDAGCEQAAMAAILELFGEAPESRTQDRDSHDRSHDGSHDPNRDHTRARLAWAAAHGLVSLEIAGRFPPGADLDAAWRRLVEALAG